MRPREAAAMLGSAFVGFVGFVVMVAVIALSVGLFVGLLVRAAKLVAGSC